MTLLNTVLLLRVPLPSLALPLWITERTGAPERLVSALFILNTGAVTLFQVHTARSVTGLGTAARALRRSGVLMLLTCTVLALSAGTPPWAAITALVGGSVLPVAAAQTA